jgi:hypothetical protein
MTQQTSFSLVSLIRPPSKALELVVLVHHVFFFLPFFEFAYHYRGKLWEKLECLLGN